MLQPLGGGAEVVGGPAISITMPESSSAASRPSTSSGRRDTVYFTPHASMEEIDLL